jgi:hypothetical protein
MPLKSRVRLKSKGFHLKQTPLRKVSDKQKVELRLRAEVKRELIKTAPKDERGIPLCSECGKPVDWDWRSPNGDLSHDKSLAQGGKTNTKDNSLKCRHCHNMKRHGIREIMY